MTDIKKNILTKKSTMSDAIRVLQECELKIICIVENNKLVGTITDGDIRRALLKNLTLDCDCNKIMNTNPEYSTTNNYLLTKNLLNTHSFVPIIDDKNNLIRIVSKTNIDDENSQSCSIVIMAGGRGERLHPLTLDTPKPLLPLQKNL